MVCALRANGCCNTDGREESEIDGCFGRAKAKRAKLIECLPEAEAESPLAGDEGKLREMTVRTG